MIFYSADIIIEVEISYSAFHLMDVTNMNIVGEYQGKITPDLFANVLNEAGKEFGNCMLVVENNTVGFAVLEKLIDWKYQSWQE